MYNNTGGKRGSSPVGSGSSKNESGGSRKTGRLSDTLRTNNPLQKTQSNLDLKKIGVGDGKERANIQDQGTLSLGPEDMPEDFRGEDGGEDYPIPPDPRQILQEENLRRFNEECIEVNPNDESYVTQFRGFTSEPIFGKGMDERFEMKRALFDEGSGHDVRGHHEVPKALSMEDVYLRSEAYPQLLQGTLSNLDLRPYEVSGRIVSQWERLFAREKARMSFFDELFAMGYVSDSLEVPGRPNDPEYLIEAEPSAYRSKIDYGRVVLKTKNVYTGNFVDWYFEGPGKYVWIDGATYRGDFQNGVMHGEGVLLWPDGTVYEGQFVNGLRGGWGVFSAPDGYTYAGEWEQGLPHGQGKMWYDPTSDELDFYEGAWDHGTIHGYGIRQYSTGDRYAGHWVRGIREGKGEFTWVEANQIYTGDFVDGVPHGKGKHIWYLPRTALSLFPTRHVYEGEWEGGLRSGIGRMIYPCGSQYEGRWYEGTRDGKGVFINSAGDMLVGLFRLGSILGGSDVPLHAPTYDSDFVGLLHDLNHKFRISHVMDPQEEATNLSKTTIRFLTEIRALFKRAGILGHFWASHGVFPEWLKENPAEAKTRLTHGSNPGSGGIILHNYSQSQVPSRPGTVNSDGEVPAPSKGLSPDHVHPLTRFGLWLLLRDCPGILDDVTFEEMDSICNSFPSISFQTKHNPFEPVYLWQFLQYLIIVATVVFIEIPRRKRRLEFEVEAPFDGQPDDGFLPPPPEEEDEDEEELEDEVKVEIIEVPDEGTVTQTTKEPPAVDPHLPPTQSLSVLGPENNQIQPPQVEGQMTLYECTGCPPSEEPTTCVPAICDATRHENLLKRMESAMSLKLREDFPEDFEDEEEAQGSSEETEDKEEVETMDPRNLEASNINQAFEFLLIHKLLPCLDRPEGKHLPPVPIPMPSLSDLYESFKGVANEDELISGPQFLQSVLTSSAFPGPNDALYWTRSKEPLSPLINLVPILEYWRSGTRDGFNMRPGDDEVPEEIHSLGPDFLGQQLNDPSVFTKKLKREARASFDHADLQSVHFLRGEQGSLLEQYSSEKRKSIFNESPDDSNSVSIVDDYGWREEEFGGEDGYEEECQGRGRGQGQSEPPGTIDYVPFSERDVVADPFLWLEKPKCIQVKRRTKGFGNLGCSDVLRVLRQLYPKITGCTSGINVNFKLNFCDWIFATCLVGKLSADREFYKAMSHVPVTPLDYSLRSHTAQRHPGGHSAPFPRTPPNICPKGKDRKGSERGQGEWEEEADEEEDVHEGHDLDQQQQKETQLGNGIPEKRSISAPI